MQASTHLLDKLDKGPPYKLLALDGGGIRGLLSIEILAEMERLLQQQLGKDDRFVLSDYFEYVAGTSTGAVIATCLSLGMRVAEVRSMYLESAELMFDKASVLKRLRYKYDDEPLAAKLQSVLSKRSGEATPTLGTTALKTLLMVVLRNATTDSPWPLSNNPRAQYNTPLDRPGCNLHLPLWQIVRGSCAAPTYFPPEQVKINERAFVFVDGGITPYNNPAFKLFLMATVDAYQVNWRPRNSKDMLLVSIGTGSAAQFDDGLSPRDMNFLYNCSTIPSALMHGCLNEQDLLCRVFGDCLEGGILDRELNKRMDTPHLGLAGAVDPKLFTYVRYNAQLDAAGLNEMGLSHIEPRTVQQLDSVSHKAQLQEIGKWVGKSKVRAEHFADFI